MSKESGEKEIVTSDDWYSRLGAFYSIATSQYAIAAETAGGIAIYAVSKRMSPQQFVDMLDDIAMLFGGPR